MLLTIIGSDSDGLIVSAGDQFPNAGRQLDANGEALPILVCGEGKIDAEADAAQFICEDGAVDFDAVVGGLLDHAFGRRILGGQPGGAALADARRPVTGADLFSVVAN